MRNAGKGTALSVDIWDCPETLDVDVDDGFARLLRNIRGRFPFLGSRSCLAHLCTDLISVLNTAICEKPEQQAALAIRRMMYDLSVGIRFVLFRAGEAKLADYMSTTRIAELVAIGRKLARRENGRAVCPQISSQIQRQRELQIRPRRRSPCKSRDSTVAAVRSVLSGQTIAEATYEEVGVQEQTLQEVCRIWVLPELREDVLAGILAMGCHFAKWKLRNGSIQAGWSIPDY